MGVALILGPMMLFFMVLPFIYTILFGFIVRGVARQQKTSRAKMISMFIVILVFLIIPLSLALDYLRFSESCNTPQKKFNITELPNIKTIAFVTESHGQYSTFLWHKEMGLMLDEYEHASIVNGVESPAYFCSDALPRCTYGKKITSKYMFLVTAPKKNNNGVLQSNISIVDRGTGINLYKAHEFILNNFASIYYATFISDKSSSGTLACGYLGTDTYTWRPNNSIGSSQRYARADADIITSFFPSLRGSTYYIEKAMLNEINNLKPKLALPKPIPPPTPEINSTNIIHSN